MDINSISEQQENTRVSETDRLAHLDQIITELAESSPIRNFSIVAWLGKNVFSVLVLAGWIGTSLIGGGGWLRGQAYTLDDLKKNQDQLHQDFVKLQQDSSDTYARKDVLSEDLKRLEEKVQFLTDLMKSDYARRHPANNNTGGN